MAISYRAKIDFRIYSQQWKQNPSFKCFLWIKTVATKKHKVKNLLDLVDTKLFSKGYQGGRRKNIVINGENFRQQMWKQREWKPRALDENFMIANNHLYSYNDEVQENNLTNNFLHTKTVLLNSGKPTDMKLPRVPSLFVYRKTLSCSHFR